MTAYLDNLCLSNAEVRNSPMWNVRAKIFAFCLIVCFVCINTIVVVAVEEVPFGEEPLTPAQLEAFEAELVRPQVAECNDGILRQVTELECQALADLYNQTYGELWENDFSSFSVPWFTTAFPCNWDGIDCYGDAERGVSHIRLDGRGLRGQIPTSIGGLTRLRGLYLTNNRLTGEIPVSITNMKQLVTLALRGNALSGEIPPELGNLPRLHWLHLEDNLLEGPIPTEFGDLGNLWSLNLSNNVLTGTIPSSMGELETLRHLHLQNNELSGEIPAELGNFPNGIDQIDLSNNKLSGELPAELGDLISFDFLRVRHNELSGVIPAEFSSLRTDEFDLSHNKFVGPLPSTLADFRVANRVDMSHNLIDGELPADLGSAQPNFIDLEYNQLEGEINVSDVFGGYDVDYNRLKITGSSSLSYYYSSPQNVPNILQGGNRRSYTDPLSHSFSWRSPYRTATPFEESELEYATDPDGPWTTVSLPALTRYHELTFPEYDTTYYTRVRSRGLNSGVSFIDNAWSEYSEVLEVKTASPTNLPPIMIPSYHVNQYVAPTTVRVFWAGINYASLPGHHEVEYAKSPDGPWLQAGMTSGRHPHGMQIVLPKASTTYYVRMRSFTEFESGDLMSVYSNLIQVQTADDRYSPVVPLSSGVNRHTAIVDRYYSAMAAALLSVSTLLLVLPHKKRPTS